MVGTILGAVVAVGIVIWAVRAYYRRARINWGHRYSLRQEQPPDIAAFSSEPTHPTER